MQGGDAEAVGNILSSCKYFGQVSVFAAGSESYNNFNISNNRITGLSSETTKTVISISPKGSNVRIVGNTLYGGTGRLISAGECTNLIIADNDCRVSDDVSQRVISIASSSPEAIVKDNTLFSGLRQSFIASDALNVVVKDNHCKVNTPLFTQSSGNMNNLLVNNSAYGTSPIASGGSTAVGNRLAGNYAMGNQTNIAPGPLYSSSAGGPAVQFTGMYIQVGQEVIDSTPTAGTYAAWTAITSGLSESVTYKQSSAIVP